MNSVLVMGARGQTGREVFKSLIGRADVQVRGACRKPVGDNEVRFDWSEPSTWAPALEGASALYLVKPVAAEWTNVAETVGQFLSMAKDLQRVVLLSEIGGGERDDALEERKTEKLLEDSKLEWTILRPHWFIQNFAEPGFFLNTLKTEGEISIPTKGMPTSFVDTRDIGDVAVCALLESAHVGKHYTLTGPQAYTWSEVIAKISSVAGYEMRYVDIPLEEFMALPAFKHMSQNQLDHVAEVYKLLQSPYSATISQDIELATGRKARSLDQFIEESRALWLKS